MRPFAIGTTILLAATSTLAAPFNSTTPHFLAKRDNVCAFDFRQGFDRTQCIGKGVKYTLTPPSAMNRVALAVRTFILALLDRQLITVGRLMNSPTDRQMGNAVCIDLCQLVNTTS